MKKWKFTRPKHVQIRELTGMSRSKFKTSLKLAGFKLARNFYGKFCGLAAIGKVTYKLEHSTYFYGKSYRFVGSGKFVRFRFGAGEVDISCSVNDFDRWANSTEHTYPIPEFIEKFILKKF